MLNGTSFKCNGFDVALVGDSMYFILADLIKSSVGVLHWVYV